MNGPHMHPSAAKARKAAVPYRKSGQGLGALVVKAVSFLQGALAPKPGVIARGPIMDAKASNVRIRALRG